MTPDKDSKRIEQSSKPQGAGPARKSWVPRSPVESMLELINKQEKKVADLQKDLEKEKATLGKLLQAKKVLEST